MPSPTLEQLLRPASVLLPLEAADKAQAVKALIATLGIGGAAEQQELETAVLDREKAGSTGLGRGVAVPHARSRLVSKPALAVGIARDPIDFASIDKLPVRVIFLLIVPQTDYPTHLKTLAALSRLASDKAKLRRLEKAGSPGDIRSLLAESSL